MMRYLQCNLYSDLENENKVRGMLLKKLSSVCPNIFVNDCNCPVCETFSDKTVCRYSIYKNPVSEKIFQLRIFPKDIVLNDLMFLMMPIVKTTVNIITANDENFLDENNVDESCDLLFLMKTPLDIGKNGKKAQYLTPNLLIASIQSRLEKLELYKKPFNKNNFKIKEIQTKHVQCGVSHDIINKESYVLSGFLGRAVITVPKKNLSEFLLLNHISLGRNISKGCGKVEVIKQKTL